MGPQWPNRDVPAESDNPVAVAPARVNGSAAGSDASRCPDSAVVEFAVRAWSVAVTRAEPRRGSVRAARHAGAATTTTNARAINR